MKRLKRNTDRQNTWIAEGLMAAKAGQPLDSCPYQFRIVARSAWLVGWQNGGGNLKTGKVRDV